MDMSEFWFVNEEGEVGRTELTNKQFILKTPLGGFTTMKCGGYGHMFHLKNHIERLRFTYNGVYGKDLDYETVEKKLMEQLKNLEEKCCNWEAWRITTLIYSRKESDDPNKMRMQTHVMPIPDAYPNKSVPASIVEGDRLKHGEMKSTHWVVERAPILDAKHETADEAFLLEKDGTVREGCLSNLFVLMEGKVYTAKDIIVNGTVRDVCVKAMEKAKMDVVLQNPQMKDIEKWEECWYTSQTKGLYLITEFWHKGKLLKKFKTEKGKEVQRLTMEHIPNFWTKVWTQKK